MSFSPQKFREIIFQLLFSIDIGNCEEEDLIPFLMQELSVTRKIVREAHKIAEEVWIKRDEVDKLIEGLSMEYALERIGKVERNVLRLGVYELLYTSDLPAEVAIAESMRLARKFSTPEAASYVNAIMDVMKEKKSETNSNASISA